MKEGLRHALKTGLCLLAWLWLGCAAATYDPPRDIDTGPTPTDARDALLASLPAGAQVRLGPLRLPFGAHAEGWLVAFQTSEPPAGQALWYLAAPPVASTTASPWRLIRLRDPQPADEYIDVQVTSAFAAGPEGSVDIVVLERLSRAAPAGHPRADIGTVYRRQGDGAQPVPALAPLLDGATDMTQARRRLAPVYAQLLPRVPGRLAAAFVSLPLRYVDLTRLERLQRLQPGDPMHAIHDPAHGYLLTRGDGGLPGYVLALFRRDGGGMLLAVQQRWPQAQRTWFLAGDAAHGWQDVSHEVLPDYAATADYTLPRQGRRLSLPDGRAWVWDGRHFAPDAR